MRELSFFSIKLSNDERDEESYWNGSIYRNSTINMEISVSEIRVRMYIVVGTCMCVCVSA